MTKPKRTGQDVTGNHIGLIKLSGLLLLAIGGVAAIYAGDAKTAGTFFVVLLINTLVAWRRAGVPKQLQEMLHRVMPSLVGLELVVLVVAWRTGMTRYVSFSFGLAVLAATVPSSLLVIDSTIRRFASSKHRATALARAFAGATADSISEIWLVLISLGANVIFHLPLALTALQILAINMLVVLLPAATLAWDPHPTRSTIGLRKFLGFGLLASSLSYANFLLFFARKGLSARYLSIHNPLYFEATTLALLTLVLCQCLHLLLLRADEHKSLFTDYLWSNERLLQAFGISFFLLLNLMYNPLARHYFGTGPLSVTDWLTAIVFAGVYLGCRLLQRHTRKHSRHAVLQLHRQVSSFSHPTKT